MDLSLKEIEIEKRLQSLEMKRQELKTKKKDVDLRKISVPDDLAEIVKSRRNAAIARNAELLRDLELACGRLHTRNMCPLEKKLEEMKTKFWNDCSPPQREPEFPPDMV